jgi:hypothetical protein
LFYSEDLTNSDTLALNMIYEEKQVLHFRYAIVGATVFSTVSNYFVFRYNSAFFQFMYFSSSLLIGHMLVGARLNSRFNKLIEPYYEKYHIKWLYIVNRKG